MEERTLQSGGLTFGFQFIARWGRLRQAPSLWSSVFCKMRMKGFILDPSGELKERLCVKAQPCVPDTASHKQHAPLPAALRSRKVTLESAGAARYHSW